MPRGRPRLSWGRVRTRRSRLSSWGRVRRAPSAYLSEQHRDTPATGCALVPLGAAAGRDGTDGDVHLKDAYERQVRAYLDLIAGLDENAEDAEEARAEAVLTLSALVGAVLMSRAVADGDLSDELLETVNRRLKHRAGSRPARP
ncbi:hypothetical protein [Streptomyces sp. NPDC101237]|uniref:hypothetical protein n=1 Tax=Streptomyces sp. NPDC101237 TaxID=3366139 RepID=UPI003813C1D9